MVFSVPMIVLFYDILAEGPGADPAMSSMVFLSYSKPSFFLVNSCFHEQLFSLTPL
jgi:hypothetical protein